MTAMSAATPATMSPMGLAVMATLSSHCAAVHIFVPAVTSVVMAW